MNGTNEIIDLGRFDQITMGDPALQRRLLAAFVSQAPALRAELAGVHDGAQALSDVLHKLRGGCHFIAADRLLAATAEPAPSEDRDEVVRRVMDELDAVDAQARRLLAASGRAG